MDIGLAIYKIRKQKGLKLETIATVAETDTGYLSRIEKGSRLPSIPMLEKIAAALGCAVSEIFAVAEASTIVADLSWKDGATGPKGGDNLRSALRDLSDEEYSLVVDFARLLSRRRLAE